LQIFYKPNNKQIKLVKDNRSFISAEGYWQVYPVGFDYGHCVYIVCPHCGEIHIHGAQPGHRLSHCNGINDNNGYEIIMPKLVKASEI